MIDAKFTALSGGMMTDPFNRVKSQIGRYITLAGLILAMTWWLAGSILPSSLVGLSRFVLVIAFLAGVIYLAFRMGGGVLKKRRTGMQLYAAKAGYAFKPVIGVSEGAEFLKSLNHFFLFSHERGVLGTQPDDETDARTAKIMDVLGNLDVTNQITGTTSGYRFQTFDFRYSPHQQTKMAQRTTVFMLTLAGADLPTIRLIPRVSEGALGTLFAKLGGNEIDLPGHPRIGQLFILSGTDKPAIEDLFIDGPATTLEQLGQEIDKLTIEIAGDKLLLYRFDILANPGQFGTLLAAATRIADALTVH